MRRRVYDVGVPKEYFPKSAWPKGVAEFVRVHKVKAASRTEAANKVWAKYGKGYLLRMGPRQTKLPRKISLFVSGGEGTPPGRLRPVLVHTG